MAVFQNCGSLVQITFECGNQLLRVEPGAFVCSGLRGIDIPSSVEFVGSDGCNDGSLASVTIDNPRQLL
jgi:hypothetical protein